MLKNYRLVFKYDQVNARNGRRNKTYQQKVHHQEELKDLGQTSAENNNTSVTEQEHLIEDIKEERVENEGERDVTKVGEAEDTEEKHAGIFNKTQIHIKIQSQTPSHGNDISHKSTKMLTIRLH